MKALKRGRRRALIVGIAAVAFAAAGTVAYASIPDTGGVIHGCYKNGSGDLRVVDSSTDSCKSSEIGLDWNQRGIPGAQGPRGRRGHRGHRDPRERDTRSRRPAT
jgi:hypothetical protein